MFIQFAKQGLKTNALLPRKSIKQLLDWPHLKEKKKPHRRILLRLLLQTFSMR